MLLSQFWPFTMRSCDIPIPTEIMNLGVCCLSRRDDPRERSSGPAKSGSRYLMDTVLTQYQYDVK